MHEIQVDCPTPHDILNTKEARDQLVSQLKATLTLVDYGDGQTFYKSKDQNVSQIVIDSVFTEEKRQKKIAEASNDIKGRPVRYYREISINHLLNIINNAEESPNDYHKGVPNPSENQLRALCSFLLSIRDKKMNIDKPIANILTLAFPNANQSEIMNLLKTDDFDWKSALSFIQKNLSEKELKLLHSVAFSGREHILPFSPFFSICPGGPRFYPPTHSQVIIEMVIPDSEVSINESNKTLAEREALVTKVKRSYISKIIFSEKAFIEQIILNPTTPIGEFVTKKADEGVDISRAHSMWFREVPIGETIPASLSQ